MCLSVKGGKTLVTFCSFMACPPLVDVLRQRQEFLSPMLYKRAVYKHLWASLVPRGEYEKGAGYQKSSFKTAQSQPCTDEEVWNPICAINQTTNPNSGCQSTSGACAATYNDTQVGYREDIYKPEDIWLRGPWVCQDEFTMAYKSEAFWADFFESLEKRTVQTVVNRAGNVYMQYIYKCCCNGNVMNAAVGKWQSAQPAPSYVDMSDYTTGSLGLPTSLLTQDMLDSLANILQQNGVQEGDTNGWISMGDSGAQFPIYIGSQMSKQLCVQNPELRADLNYSYMGLKQMNPTLQRMGSARILGNWRHVINLFPPRWIFVPNNISVRLVTDGVNSSSGNVWAIYNNSAGVTNNTVPIGNSAYDFAKNPAGTPAVNAAGVLIRLPTYALSTQAVDVTKGVAPIPNGCYMDNSITGAPNNLSSPATQSQATASGSNTGTSMYEGAVTLHPMVMTEEVLIPVNSMPGMKLNPQNYYGEWTFVTGNDAALGMDGCTGIADPTKAQGRHFGQYRHAFNPIHPEFARLILYRVCSSPFSTLQCS